MPNRLRVLELFCGIGGCAAALDDRATIVAAVDINAIALAVHRRNFASPPLHVRTIESLPAFWYREQAADLWWLSPPCRPYTSRGRRLDLNDERAQGLLAVSDRIAELRPPYVGLENVAGFQGSQSHRRLRAVLDACGYQVHEQLLCPTQLGVPNRRPRFYLVASRAVNLILRLLGFPASYRLPDELPVRKAWQLVGNSLSVAAVRHVLAAIPVLGKP